MTLGPGQHVLPTEIYPLVIKHGCDITYKRRFELENHVLNGASPTNAIHFRRRRYKIQWP